MQIGILAYGSLIDDPGAELEPYIVNRLKDVETPFGVEFARSSRYRGGAPTLVPVERGGARVRATILVLDEGVLLEDAMDMLYRREINAVGNLKCRYEPDSAKKDAVHIGQLRGGEAWGLDVVLYTILSANVDPLTPEHLAKLAIRSARSKVGQARRDGISYLMHAMANGIRTPLTEGYEQAILLQTGVDTLEEAWQINQRLSGEALEQFDGIGKLRCQHGRCRDCSFSVIRLLNGRLQVHVIPAILKGEYSSSEEWNAWLRRCEPFVIEGEDGVGNQISASEIHFTRTRLGLRKTLIGYAQSAARHSQEKSYSGEITIKCELTGIQLSSLGYPMAIQADDFPVEIGRLGLIDQGEIYEHSTAYRHTTISAYLRIRNIPVVNLDRAIECLRGIATLLSVASRQYAFQVVQHRFDADGQWLDSQFFEPPFTARGWPRTLIPDESLADFLTTAYPHFTAKYQGLELGNAIDHYLQSLTLHSIWPASLGVFTAMETLKSAFFRQTEDTKDAGFEFWVVPSNVSNNFEDKAELFDELIDVLCHHFPRFCELNDGEKQSLKAQLRGLNRRSYRTQLKRILNRLQVDYQESELQPFIAIRNNIIHRGAPIESSLPSADYWAKASMGWKQIEAATALFEKALLAVLGYAGPSELFDTPDGAQVE
jgi:hypothetical protein